MTNELDAELQWIRQAMPDVAADPELLRHQRETLMATILDSSPSRAAGARPKRRRRSALLLAPVGAVVLAAAGWAVLRDQPDEAAAFSCVAEGVVSVLPNDGTPPLEACQALWASGAMSSGTSEAPALVACVSGRGGVEVLEAVGHDACGEAGMTEWEGLPAYEEAGSAVRSALISFHDRNQATGNGCASEQDWRDALGESLGAGWTVTADPIEDGRTCYDLGTIDPVEHEITIIGVPGDHSIGCDPRTGC